MTTVDAVTMDSGQYTYTVPSYSISASAEVNQTEEHATTGSLNDQKERTSTSLLVILREFTEVTTLHGFAHVTRMRSRYNCLGWKNKLFLLVTLCCIGMAANNVFYIVADFLRYPVVTETHTDTRGRVVFPAVTICNNNKWNKITGPYVSTEELDKVPPEHRKKILRHPRNPFRDYQDPKGEVASHTDRDTLLYFTGHTVINMLRNCTFGNSPCNASDFYWSYDDKYGSCYTFNSNTDVFGHKQELRGVGGPGLSLGLTMELNVDLVSYNKQTVVAGIRMLVHDNKQKPFPGDDSIMLSPGSYTYVGVQKREIKRAQPPYGNCKEFEGQEHKRVSFFADRYVYSASACLKTCIQKAAMLFCNCCLDSVPCNPLNVSLAGHGSRTFPQYSRRCNLTEAELCESSFKEGNEFLDECRNECHPRCFDTEYDMTISSAKWPPRNTRLGTVRYYEDNTWSDYFEWAPVLNSQNLSQDFKEHLDVALFQVWLTKAFNQFQSNNLKVSVYLESMGVQNEVKSPKYEWSSFLSNIGGVMGLFTGFSILSFFEMVELLLDLWAYGVSAIRRRVCGRSALVVAPYT